MGGADEIFQLAREFGDVPTKVALGLYDAYASAGETFRLEWQANARDHFDSHAKRYPDSISTETRRGGLMTITTDTGPEASSDNQGFLGRILEFGGEHSPAYLDGLRAMSAAERRIEQLTDTTIEEALR